MAKKKKTNGKTLFIPESCSDYALRKQKGADEEGNKKDIYILYDVSTGKIIGGFDSPQEAIAGFNDIKE